MKTSHGCTIVGLALALGGCGEAPRTFTAPVFETDMSVVANGGRHAAVPLSGAEEVPARPTRARGTATFQLSADGTALHYQLIVANIRNVVASHIHVGAAGTNGPVGVFLFGPAPAAGGRLDGVIAEGTITAAAFVGPLAGQTIADLVTLMQDGTTYVNVHTNDGVSPTDTGPGDFPGGEIRGQIR